MVIHKGNIIWLRAALNKKTALKGLKMLEHSIALISREVTETILVQERC